jgi:hypothetical protein
MAQLTIGQYLFTRLKQLGLQTVFGVPGGKHLALGSEFSCYMLIQKKSTRLWACHSRHDPRCGPHLERQSQRADCQLRCMFYSLLSTLKLLSSNLTSSGWWLCTREWNRSFRDYLWPWRAIRILWRCWTICWICKLDSFTPFYINECPLGTCCSYRRLSVYDSHEKQSRDAPQSGKRGIRVSLVKIQRI